MPKLVSRPFSFRLSKMSRQDQRFDLILRGVRHIGCSYEGRIFLNNVNADEATAKSPEQGYAGSFYVFGKGDCYGATGHCDPPTERLPYDDTPPVPSLPIEIHLDISDMLVKTARESKSEDIQLSIVPIANRTAPSIEVDDTRLMEISGSVSIVGYA